MYLVWYNEVSKLKGVKLMNIFMPAWVITVIVAIIGISLLGLITWVGLWAWLAAIDWYLRVNGIRELFIDFMFERNKAKREGAQ
jgi:hypothetical protein